MFLELRDLFVNYGPHEILKGVSLEIDEGQIGVLLGANGSGKSTILKTITGLVRAKSGSIWFQGKKIDRLNTPNIIRNGIALVPEGRRVFPVMTVLQNLKMGAYIRNDRQEIAKDLQEMYRQFPVLEAKRNEFAAKLSGGEQQMLAIARALMTRPKLLLMDEPSQGLAPLIVNEIADVITRIKKTGLTFIIVEHNLRLGLSIADQVFVLESGKIAYKGKANDLSQVEYAKKIYLGS